MPKTTPALLQIFEPIRADLEKVDSEFARHVQSQVELIPRIGEYIQTSGGKRIRPAVLLMASRLSGYQGDRAILYAAVVEFIHTATLVHDDIIDGADVRRGRLAVHSRWGNDITVLLGDYLYIKSMGMALTLDRLDLVRLLCDVTLRMIEGELYQLTKNGDAGITEDERRTVAEMMAKGTFSSILLATKDVDGTFERLQAGDAEVVQEPTDQPYGVRDCAFRDPAGNLIRIQELT